MFLLLLLVIFLMKANLSHSVSHAKSFKEYRKKINIPNVSHVKPFKEYYKKINCNKEKSICQ